MNAPPKLYAAAILTLGCLIQPLAIIAQPETAAAQVQITQFPDNLAGENGIYKRDELIKIRYWRVVNPNGTRACHQLGKLESELLKKNKYS
ncbi:MAG: hypothetical protein ACHBN1_21445 [Heteroscytonema crispum UTEX LB 1556]